MKAFAAKNNLFRINSSIKIFLCREKITFKKDLKTIFDIIICSFDA